MDTRFKKGMTPWNKPKEPILISCKVCGASFVVKKCFEKTRKYCARKCAFIGQSKERIGNKYRLGTTQSSETRKLMSEQRKGEKNGNWIADRSLLKKQEERFGNRHKAWSRHVKNRDGWECKISNGDCSGQVIAHHILPWRDYVELRYEVNNGITLCHFHHPRKRNDEMRLSPYFQELVNNK